MIKPSVLFALTSLLAFGCAGAADGDATGAGDGSQDATDAASAGFPTGGVSQQVKDGVKNFLQPIPKGNGRACATCHVPEKNFTIAPADVEARFQQNPNDPLFRSIDADDFASDFTTLRSHALFRVTIPLPANVSIVGSAAREVKLFRSVPTVFNVKLSAPYTADGRDATLAGQALGAALEHSRPTKTPGASFFDAIAAAEQLAFSSPIVKSISDAIDAGQPTPPVGQDYDGGALTPEEQTGFGIFQQKCLFCHGTNTRGKTTVFPSNFISIRVSELNRVGLPTLQYQIANADGTTTVTAPTPDPGRVLVTGNARDVNSFDITQLRGVSKTAPYFHDNSAATLVDVLRHYNEVFPGFNITPIPEDQFPALLAYLNRL